MVLAHVIAVLATFAAAPAAPADALQGTWLFDAAALKKHSELGRVWESVVTVKGDAFALSQLMGSKNDLKGTLVFDPANPRAVDLKTAELDLSELLPDYKVPAGTLPAIYKLDGDRLTLCFPTTYRGKRPTAFAASADAYLVTLVRAPKDFKDFPKEVTLTATRPDGKPAAGATVSGFMSYNRPDPAKKDAKAGWESHNPVVTGADGSVVVKVETVQNGQCVVRDTANGTMALVSVSPAKLAAGRFRAELVPEVRVTGTITCDELTKAGQPLGYTNLYLLSDGGRVAYWASEDGMFEFVAPPGKYTLHVYGDVVDGKFVDIVVPAGKAEFAPVPIALQAAAFALMKGKPAPELEGIVGWKGDKAMFADLKGKYVLVEFWGYWCGPCVGSMPVLIELHEKFADKGLAIVGVHVDVDGEVDTAAKLDARIATYKKDVWKGKGMPFPNALASGARSGDDAKRGGPVAQYGVQSYPTTILIDREGKVVGKFHAREIKSASSEIENLLNLKK